MNATNRLTAAGVETPDRDARALLLHAEKIDHAALLASPDAAMSAATAFENAILRRCKREPVSKIVGYRDFWKHRFAVTRDVLDPRPDTETLIEAVLDVTVSSTKYEILDLGTGSGCIVLSLLSELTLSKGTGVDRSEAALMVAKRNAEALKVGDRVDFLVSDWFEALDGTFNLVVCNPPYISTTESAALSPEVTLWDPEEALFAGMDGLQAYRKIVDGLATVLKPDGAAFFEIGLGQAELVKTLLIEAGFRRVSSRRDLGGRERCLIARRS